MNSAYDPEDVEQLEAFDWQAQRNAIRSIAAKGHANAQHAGQVAGKLGHEEVEVRLAACIALPKLGDGKYAKHVSRCLNDSKPAVRRAAVEALAAFGSGPSGPFSVDIAKLVKDTDDGVRTAAAAALGLIGSPAAVEPFLSDRSPAVRKNAIAAAQHDRAVLLKLQDKIAACLMDPDPGVRLAAVKAIGEIGNVSEAHIAMVAALSTDKNRGIRMFAVQTLAKLGSTAWPMLFDFLRDEDDGVSQTTGVELVKAGEMVVKGVAALLEDSDPSMRLQGETLLSRMGVASEPFVDAIADRIQDTDLRVRVGAIQALGDMGIAGKRHLETVASLATTDSLPMRQAAVPALTKMGAEGAAALAIFLKDSNPAVRYNATRAFNPTHSHLKAAEALPYASAVSALLQDSDAKCRNEAAKALGELGASQHAAGIATLAGDEKTEVRRTAVLALGKLGAEGSVHLSKFDADASDAVRREAERAKELINKGSGGYPTSKQI